MATLEQDVLGLDIPVQHVVLVREAQGIGHLGSDPQRVVEGKLLLSLQPLPQGLPFHIRHDVVRQPLGFA